MIKVSFYHEWDELNPEQAKKKEIMKVSTSINTIENRKTMAKSLQTKS